MDGSTANLHKVCNMSEVLQELRLPSRVGKDTNISVPATTETWSSKLAPHVTLNIVTGSADSVTAALTVSGTPSVLCLFLLLFFG